MPNHTFFEHFKDHAEDVAISGLKYLAYLFIAATIAYKADKIDGEEYLSSLKNACLFMLTICTLSQAGIAGYKTLTNAPLEDEMVDNNSPKVMSA